jgi:hypothetical protein
MGIYAIDPATGGAVIAVDTGPQGYRFFGLDYNVGDDHLYGYTEYGNSGLYAIDIDSGAMVRLVGSPPGVNGQGRALAVGNNTVYLLATRGDEQEPCFAYDLAQGSGGVWVAFTNPYPTSHATGGATWIPAPADLGETMSGADGLRLDLAGASPCAKPIALVCGFSRAGEAQLDVFNTLGCRVATPFRGSVGMETRSITWDLRSEDGRKVPGGVYFLRLVSGGDARSARLVVVGP